MDDELMRFCNLGDITNDLQLETNYNQAQYSVQMTCKEYSSHAHEINNSCYLQILTSWLQCLMFNQIDLEFEINNKNSQLIFMISNLTMVRSKLEVEVEIIKFFPYKLCWLKYAQRYWKKSIKERGEEKQHRILDYVYPFTDPKNISVKPTDQDQFFQGLQKLITHVLPLDQGIAMSLLLHAESNPSLRGARLDSIKNLVSDYQPSQTQSQGPRQPEQPYWNGSHARMPDFQNEAPQDLIDENQKKELQDMMAEGGHIYPLYIRASSMVMNHPQAAINSFKKLLKLTQKYAVIYFNCGEAAFQIGQDALAEAMMREYLRLHEKKKFVFSQIYCFAHYHIGVSMQYQNKDLKEAEYYLQKAVSLDQKCLVFTQALSKFYYETNQFDKSAQFSQTVIDQFEEQTKKFSPNSQTYFDDIVELSRTYHVQMCAAKKSKNMEGLVLSAEKLSKLDELNFEFIMGELNEVIMSQEYSFEEKRKLCELMSKSEEFDIIVEEFEVLLALQQKDLNLKVKCHSELSQKYQIEAKPLGISEDQQKLFSADEVGQTQLQLEQHIDQQLIDLILPERADLPSKLNFEEAMSKRKNRSRNQTYEQFRQKADEKKQKYPGYITDAQYYSQQYVIIFSDEIKFENEIQKKKFRQAAEKGFAPTKFNASGIKFIDQKNGERMFEIKIKGQGDRLICEKAQKIGKNRSEMKFTKLLSHKEAERFIKFRI